MALWPPQVEDVKEDLGVDDNRDDAKLQTVLDAAVAVVERELAGSYNWTGAPLVLLPAPGPNIVLGTIRYAGRWHSRRRSPDGTIDLGEFGSARVPSFDPDIELLLGLGRYRCPVLG